MYRFFLGSKVKPEVDLVKPHRLTVGMYGIGIAHARILRNINETVDEAQ